MYPKLPKGYQLFDSIYEYVIGQKAISIEYDQFNPDEFEPEWRDIDTISDFSHANIETYIRAQHLAYKCITAEMLIGPEKWWTFEFKSDSAVKFSNPWILERQIYLESGVDLRFLRTKFHDSCKLTEAQRFYISDYTHQPY
jgi:hypothetical protein